MCVCTDVEAGDYAIALLAPRRTRGYVGCRMCMSWNPPTVTGCPPLALPFSLYTPSRRRPGAAIWYSTPVISLLICSDSSPRTLVWLPDTPRGAWKPPWPRGGRRRGGCSLRGRPGLLREERDFGSGRVQIDVPLLEGAALVLYSFPRAGTTTGVARFRLETFLTEFEARCVNGSYKTVTRTVTRG